MPLDPSLAADVARLRIDHDALVVEVKLLRLRLWLDRTRGAELKAACDVAFARCLVALRRHVETCRKANFDPNQPRVPAGNPDGGQWTSGGGGGSAAGDDSQILSDATPDNEWIPGAQYAQAGPRGPRGTTPVLINGRVVSPTPAQAARLAVAQTQAEAAIARVQEYDPRWRPSPSAYETVEGLISRYEGEIREAEARTAYLAANGIGPGPFAVEWIPARNAGRLTAEERAELDRIGDTYGCHTCGTLNPGTPSGHWIRDHQPSRAANIPVREYPQCSYCSSRQGWTVRYLGYRR